MDAGVARVAYTCVSVEPLFLLELLMPTAQLTLHASSLARFLRSAGWEVLGVKAILNHPQLARRTSVGARRVVSAMAQGAAPSSSRDGASELDSREVAACLGGDGEAFGRIVRRYQGSIAQQLYRYSRDEAVLEELVQDVFVEAYRGLAGWRARAPLLHWLRRIATRVGYRHWTDQARRPVALNESAANDLPAPPDEGAAAQETAEYVCALLARLAPRDRLVLTLLSIEGHSVAEAASLTGWSRSMVKVQAHRARKRLAALLAPREGR